MIWTDFGIEKFLIDENCVQLQALNDGEGLKAPKDKVKHIDEKMKFLETLSGKQFEQFIKCSTASLVKDSNRNTLIKFMSAIYDEDWQPRFLDLLMNRLVDLDDPNGEIVNGVLGQLKWIDWLVDSQRFMKTCLYLLDALPLVNQKELITLLPDVITDADHESLVQAMTNLMESNKELMVPILNAFSNLHLHESNMEIVQENVLDQLESVELEDLPATIKFLLQSSTKSSIAMILKKMDLGLDLASMKNEAKNTLVLIVDSLKSGLRTNSVIKDYWLKIMMEDKSPTINDFIFILLIIDMIGMKRKAEQAFKKSLIAKSTEMKQVVKSLFKNLTCCVSGFFASLLSLADFILRSCGDNFDIGVTIYYELFKASSDRFMQQSIINGLIAHIGSGSRDEIDFALMTMWKLVKHCPKDIAQHVVLLKSVLDIMDLIGLDHIREYFEIMTILALHSDRQRNTGLISELNMIIRKYVTLNNGHYKRIGLTCGLAMVKQLGCDVLVAKEINSDSSSASASAASSSRKKQEPDCLSESFRLSREVLELLYYSCKHSMISLAMLYDELCNVLSSSQIHQSLLSWINEYMGSTFSRVFIMDLSEELEEYKSLYRGTLGIEEKYNLDGNEAELALSLVPNLVHAECHNRIDATLKIHGLCPLYRLMYSCEKCLHGKDLSGIGALLGCPVILYKVPDQISNLTESEKELLAYSLFYCINWFVEVINSFSTCNSNQETLEKTVKRVEDLANRYREFMSFVESFVPSFRPITHPENALHLSEQVGSTGLRLEEPSLIIQNLESKSETEVDDHDNNENDNNDNNENDNENYAKAKGKLVKGKANGKSKDESFTQKKLKPLSAMAMRPYFRSLNVDVYGLLPFADSNMTALQYLLDNLEIRLGELLLPPLSSSSSSVASNGGGTFDRKRWLSELPSVVKCLMKKTLPFLFEKFSRELVLLEEGDSQGGQDAKARHDHCLLAMTKKALDQTARCIEFYASHRRIEFNCLMGNPTEAFGYLCKYFDPFPSLEYAICLYKVLEGLANMTETTLNASETTQNYNRLLPLVSALKKGHFQLVRDKVMGVTFILEQELKVAKLKTENAHLDTMSLYIEEVLCGFLNQEDVILQQYNLLNWETFHVYHRILYSNMENLMISVVQDASDGVFDRLKKCLKLFLTLNTMVKEVEDSKNLRGNCLRYGKSFIDGFLKFAMPILDARFCLDSVSVNEILQILQKSTRLLQIMCGHSKADEKDTALIAKIPILRKTLETLVFRVKAMLDRNGCANAFWIGNLKHKSIKGVELSSQMPIATTGDVERSKGPKKKQQKLDPGMEKKVNEKEETASVYSSDSDSDSDDQEESRKESRKESRESRKESRKESRESRESRDSSESSESSESESESKMKWELDEGPIIDEETSIYLEEDSIAAIS